MKITEPEVRQALEALLKLDEVFCADDYGTWSGRHTGRVALIRARESVDTLKQALARPDPDVSVEVGQLMLSLESQRYVCVPDEGMEQTEYGDWVKLDDVESVVRAALLANAASAALPNAKAAQSSAKLLLERYAGAKCDCAAVSGCLRCNSVYLASWAQQVLKLDRAQPVAVQEVPRNRAVEWGEYMAKGGDNLLITMNEHAEALMALEESEDDDDIAAMTSRCEYTEQLVGEMMTGLRSDIYEFRKRVAQDAASTAPAAPTEPTMADAIAAGDGTLHGAIDYWQERALKAEQASAQPAQAEITDAEPRFFLDHGMIHDRKTGRHVHADDDMEKGATANLLSVLQELEAAIRASKGDM